MGYEIIKAVASDFEDVLDFGNYIFKIDFASLLPNYTMVNLKMPSIIML